MVWKLRVGVRGEFASEDAGVDVRAVVTKNAMGTSGGIAHRSICPFFKFNIITFVVKLDFRNIPAHGRIFLLWPSALSHRLFAEACLDHAGVRGEFASEDAGVDVRAILAQAAESVGGRRAHRP